MQESSHPSEKKQMYPLYSKKEDKTDLANYRPIYLTCVLCEVIEDVVASGISKHFTDQNILSELQHGVSGKEILRDTTHHAR